MADVPIVNRAMVTAPKDYTLPQSQEIILKCVRASIDATGAGGSYLPALQLVSNNGDVMWTAVDTSFPQAAGGTVDVSWFPGVGGGAAALSTPGLMAARVTLTGNKAIASGDPNKVISWDTVVADTGTPTPFYSAGNPTRLTAPRNGLYLPLASLNWDVWPGHAGGFFDGMGCYLYVNSGGTYTTNYTYEYNNNPVGGASAFYTLQGGHHNTLLLNTGDYVEIAAYQDSGNSVNLIDLRPMQNHYCAFSLILVAAT